jgi:tetratricopeptide (TPR) repeat protein
MLRTIWFVATAVSGLIGQGATPAFAQFALAWEVCMGKRGEPLYSAFDDKHEPPRPGRASINDTLVEACSLVLRSGKVTTRHLAVARRNRCIARVVDRYYAREILKQAIEDCDGALTLDHTMTSTLIYRGTAYALTGDYDRAIADLDAATGLYPKLAWVWYYRGYAHQGKGDYGRAAADFDEAARLDPGYRNARRR